MFDPSAWRAIAVLAIPVLFALIGAAVYHRSNRKGLRIAGLLLGLADLVLLLFIYINALMQLGVGGGFSDIIVALSAIPLAAVGSVLLFAIALKKFKLSRSWLFPLTFGLALAFVTQGFTQGFQSTQARSWAGFALLVMIVLLAAALTLFICLFKNRRQQNARSTTNNAEN
jgi:hypothetical protein